MESNLEDKNVCQFREEQQTFASNASRQRMKCNVPKYAINTSLRKGEQLRYWIRSRVTDFVINYWNICLYYFIHN